jgi:TIR domain
MKDFFISYTHSDEKWADWIAYQLEEAGYSVIYQAWDFSVGSNFVMEIDRGTVEARRTLAVLSDSYLQRSYPRIEWAAALAQDPEGATRKLLPVRVSPCTPTGLLAQVVYLDLVGKSEAEAKKLLLGTAHSKQRGRKPSISPEYPGVSDRLTTTAPTFPGHSRELIRYPHSRSPNLIFAKMSSRWLLESEQHVNPYRVFFEATDSFTEETSARVHTAVYLPGYKYISGSPLQAFTPAAAICTVSVREFVERIRVVLGDRLRELTSHAPSSLRNDQREEVFEALASASKSSLLIGVSFPEIVLRIGRRRPELAYQAMADLFLFPLLEVHRRFTFEELDIHLSRIGNEGGPLLISILKKGLRAVFPKKDSASVRYIDPGTPEEVLAWFARALAWAVGVFHNADNPKWISLLEECLNDRAEGPSTPEGPPAY